MLTAVKSDIQSRPREDLKREDIKLIAVEISKNGSKPLIPYTFNRPQDSSLTSLMK